MCVCMCVHVQLRVCVCGRGGITGYIPSVRNPNGQLLHQNNSAESTAIYAVSRPAIVMSSGQYTCTDDIGWGSYTYVYIHIKNNNNIYF